MPLAGYTFKYYFNLNFIFMNEEIKLLDEYELNELLALLECVLRYDPVTPQYIKHKQTWTERLELAIDNKTRPQSKTGN